LKKLINNKQVLSNTINCLLERGGKLLAKTKVETYLKEAETYNDPDRFLVKWAIKNNFLNIDDEIDIANVRGNFDKEIISEYLNQQTYDVFIFSKRGARGSKRLCNDNIPLEEAKKICQSDASKGANYMAGFVIHGTYSNYKQGEPFIIDNDKVINPVEN